ncbi:hypothetical protein [Blastococcus sp. TF02A-30]|uniref:hypothetical protein n=1 Tax=Blastococcus sp. TF02A-30 TaxID=2250580 RepID=UPI0011BEC7A8|nr:hypothetical protein [Blastococcus sp. TF02A-30]
MATLGSSGIPVAVGVLVNGSIIRGVIGPDSQFTESASAAVERAVGAFFPNWPAETSSTATQALQRQDERRAERRAQDREVFDRYYDESDGDFSIDDVRLADVPRVTKAAASASRLAFQQASLTPPGGTPIALENLIVEVDSIDAWWVLDDEEGAAVNYGSPHSDDS